MQNGLFLLFIVLSIHSYGMPPASGQISGNSDSGYSAFGGDFVLNAHRDVGFSNPVLVRDSDNSAKETVFLKAALSDNNIFEQCATVQGDHQPAASVGTGRPIEFANGPARSVSEPVLRGKNVD